MTVSHGSQEVCGDALSLQGWKHLQKCKGAATARSPGLQIEAPVKKCKRPFCIAALISHIVIIHQVRYCSVQDVSPIITLVYMFLRTVCKSFASLGHVSVMALAIYP